jgi:hypothetical protein
MYFFIHPKEYICGKGLIKALLTIKITLYDLRREDKTDPDAKEDFAAAAC